MDNKIRQPRMLLSLQAEIANAPSALIADCKRAECAAYLSRLGRFDEARIAIDDLRGRYDHYPHIEVSIWINLAEGLLGYFSNLGISATDRVRRAYVLSTSAGLWQMQALCAAWLAQLDYVILDVDALSSHLNEAIKKADSKNHAALSRASLVAAQALHLARRFDLAQVWYKKSREHAMSDRDDATISALMHNMAWLRMYEMRQTVLGGAGVTLQDRGVLATAESNAHLNELVGDASWPELKPLLRAQILSLQCDPHGAAILYREHLTDAKPAARLQVNVMADRAWCHVQLEELDQARICAGLALDGLVSETQLDERAPAHSRLAQVFSALGNVSESRRHLELASDAWASYVLIQSKIVVKLRDLPLIT
jgi:tetratricopeptide (TPR) repeat protein